MGEEEEQIEDAEELAQVRRQARGVQFKALLVALPVMAGVLLLPE